MNLSALQQYALVTANYWAFTLTDGALRMLVVFHFLARATARLRSRFCFCSTNSSVSSPISVVVGSEPATGYGSRSGSAPFCRLPHCCC